MKKIFIAGHRGLAGSAVRRLFSSLPDWEVVVRTRTELDLEDHSATLQFLRSEKPDVVVDAAAKVGGIKANRDFPVDFLLRNLKIQNSLIEASFQAEVAKFVFLGSSCIYPKMAPQPIPEDALLTGPLEPTNDAYAIAKIAGIRLCQAYRQQYGWDAINLMPTNLYGPGDNFDLESSHVLPGLIHKFHKAKTAGSPSVTLWGTGTPRREFLHSDDLALAIHHCIENFSGPEVVNVGTGEDVTIRELAELIRDTTGFEGELAWDSSMPDGTPRKLLDVRKIQSLGWRASIPLPSGIQSTYRWFLENFPGK